MAATSADSGAIETGNQEPKADAQADVTEGLIGIEKPEQPEAAPEGKATPFRLAETIDPETVVGYDDKGKPITAGEIHNGYLRQSEWTRRTQAHAEDLKIAQQARQIEQEIAWMRENVSPLAAALQSGDKDAAANALRTLAQELGADLGGERQRDERGRFVPKQAQADEDLEDLDEYEPDSVGYQLAERNNRNILERRAMQERLDAQEKKLDQFLGSIDKEREAIQTRQEMDALAAEWGKVGFTPDLASAEGLVGRPMGPKEAMVIAHYEQILKFNATKVAEKIRSAPQVPDEPGGTPRVPDDLSKLSLSETLRRSYASLPR